jgi:predicted O-methyltransferase YrrM
MLLEWRPVRIGDGPAILTSVTEEETAELSRLAKGIDSKMRIAEIGTAYGFSAIVMALAGAQVVTVDPHKWLRDSLEIAQKRAAQHGVADRIEFRVGRSADVFNRGEKYDGVFVDGDHAYEAVLVDCKLARSLCKPGGWIAFHDYGEDQCPGVKRALDSYWSGGMHTVVDTLWVRRRGGPTRIAPKQSKLSD